MGNTVTRRRAGAHRLGVALLVAAAVAALTAAGAATSAVAAPRTATTASALLAQIPIRPAQGGAYQRTADFGRAWLDADRNGCDTRDDILGRDLTGVVRPGSCKVTSGTLVSPYTGQTIHFRRGARTSALVQIDHVVALEDAWRTGAQQLTRAERIDLANDPIELLAVDAASNDRKGDADAAGWLPSRRSFDCAYVARQVSVKAAYGLWVTPAEHAAMARVLSSCPDTAALTSRLAPPHPSAVASAAPAAPAAPAPAAPAPAAPAPAAPAPAAPAPAAPAPAATVVHPGSFCSSAGATGVTASGTRMVCDTTATDSRLRWRSH